jgi:hypothetical protein
MPTCESRAESSPCRRTIMDKAVSLDPLTKSQCHWNHHYSSLAHRFVLTPCHLLDLVSISPKVKVALGHLNAALSIKVH